MQYPVGLMTYCRERAGGVEVAFDSNLYCLDIIPECKILEILESHPLVPVPAVEWYERNSLEQVGDGIVQGGGRTGRKRARHHNNARRVIDSNLMYSLGIELCITYLAENGLAGGDVDEDDANGRRDTSSLTDGAYDLLVLGSTDGRSTS